jgi:hypothetical protein
MPYDVAPLVMSCMFLLMVCACMYTIWYVRLSLLHVCVCGLCIYFSETSLDIQRTTWSFIPENRTLHNQNLRSYDYYCNC